MALDTLPEDEQKTGGESDLSKGISNNEVDERFGSLADRFNDKPDQAQGDSGAAASPAKAAKIGGKSFLQKNKWKLIGGIGGLTALIVPLILFFFFLLLFKLNHIKELFIDYRFAQFDRVVSERVLAAMEESKTVKVTTPDAPPADLNAPLEAQLGQAKADGLDPNTSGQDLQNLDTQAETFMQSDLAGAPGGETDTEFGVKDRQIDPVDETKPPNEVDAAVEKSLETRVDDPGTGPEGIPASEVKDDVTKVKDAVAGGESPASAADRLVGGGADALNIISKVTIACIAIDIWGAGKKAYIAYKAGGLVKAAETVYAWADGQKQGQATLGGIGAVANKFDNTNQSFINSAGGQQASGQPVTGPVLSNEAKPNNTPPFGLIGNAIDTFANIPGVPQVCSRLLQPGVQIGLAVGGVVAIIAGAISGADIPTIAIITSLVAGVGVVFAGPAGKALLVHAVASVAHVGISASAGPLDWGNYMSGGTKIMADSSCMRAMGCQQLTPKQATELNSAIRKEQIARARQKGFAYSLLATSNPRSVLSQTLFALPTSPSAMLGRLNQMFASLFSPGRWALNGSNLVMTSLGSSVAYADDTIDPITGQPFVGVPINTKRWGILENATYVEANMDSLTKKYAKCFPKTSEEYAQRIIDGSSSDCDNMLRSDTDAQRYAQYQADKYTIHALMMLQNKQAGSTGSSASSATTTSSTLSFNYEDKTRPVPGISPTRKLPVTVWLPADKQPHALIIFAPGYNKGPSDYARFESALAAKGFVVAGISFPQADPKYYQPNQLSRTPAALQQQAADVSFVITQLQNEPQLKNLITPGVVGMVGHSDGAIDAMHVGYSITRDARVTGIVSIAGDYSPDYHDGPPLLMMHSNTDNIAGPPAGDLKNFNEVTASPKFFGTILSGNHYDPIAGSTPETPTYDELTAAFLNRYVVGDKFDVQPLSVIAQQYSQYVQLQVVGNE